MRFILLLLKIIWNLKTILITGILLGSLAMNMILFLDGSLFSTVNNGFEALTGMQTFASRKNAEIAGLDEEIVLERNAINYLFRIVLLRLLCAVLICCVCRQLLYGRIITDD